MAFLIYFVIGFLLVVPIAYQVVKQVVAENAKKPDYRRFSIDATFHAVVAVLSVVAAMAWPIAVPGAGLFFLFQHASRVGDK